VAIDAAYFIIFISKNGKRSLKITILVCVFLHFLEKSRQVAEFRHTKKKALWLAPNREICQYFPKNKTHCRNVAIENRENIVSHFETRSQKIK
jgi:hypothetical protein